MSGIAAIIAENGNIGPADVRGLISAVRHRGPDDLRSWSDDTAVLVQARSGGTAIGQNFDEKETVRVAGDIRLDNAETLRRTLGLPGSASHATCIAAAYLSWGDACCTRLEGDFAFVLWDPRGRRILAARDMMGVRPLFYTQSNGSLRIASEPSAIARHGLRPLSDDRIVTYLSGLTDAGTETEQIGVSRLLPGQLLTWQGGSVRVECYAEPMADPSPDDAEAAFHDIFGRAVTGRLRHANQPAALLSGGLDSSAICAVAADAQADGSLPTYSFVHSHFPEIDESAYINAVLDRHRNLNPNLITLRDHGPLNGLQDMMSVLDGPYEAPGLLKSLNIYRRIVADGSDVVLNGHGGDEVVGHGSGRVADLARAGRWIEALALVPAACRPSGANPTQVSLALLARYGPTHRGRRALSRIGRRMTSQEQPLWRRCLRPEVAQRACLDDRLAAERRDGADEAAKHLAALRAPLVGRAFEIFDRATARVGLEARYPFYDTRLVRLCLALPSSERLRRDGGRSILRRALQDVLPKKVRTRQDKTGFGPELATGLATHHGDVLERMGADRTGLLHGFLEPKSLRAGIDALRAAPKEVDGGDAMFLWRAASLQLWFEMQVGRRELVG